MDQSPVVKKIPLILITGFLGSGKTSLLKRILGEIGSQKKIAVVQNEFAPGEVDSVELKSTGIPFDLLEINNGSVFCACLLDSFIGQLGGFIQKFKPEAIFLEATGLADPISLSQIMQYEEVAKYMFLGSVWTVVDSVNFSKSHKYIQRVRHQIQIADVILLNKSDLVLPDKGLRDQIDKWNPHADLYLTDKGGFNDLREVLLSGLLQDEKTSDLSSRQNNESLPSPDIGSCVIRTQKKFTKESLQQFHHEKKASIFRMKGYVKGKSGTYFLVQSVFDQLKIEITDSWNGPTEIIIMGPGIKPGSITKEFLKLGYNE